MPSGGIIAAGAVVPIVVIASAMILFSIHYRRRSTKAGDAEHAAKPGPKSRTKTDIATRPFLTFSVNSEPNANVDLDEKSLEILQIPRNCNTAIQMKSQPKLASVSQPEARDMRQMIANGQMGLPKGLGAEIRRPPPAGDWSDLVGWEQLRAPRIVVPDNVRISHYAW